MCASARNISCVASRCVQVQERNISCVAPRCVQFKERYHPHPTPPQMLKFRANPPGRPNMLLWSWFEKLRMLAVSSMNQNIQTHFQQGFTVNQFSVACSSTIILGWFQSLPSNHLAESSWEWILPRFFPSSFGKAAGSVIFCCLLFWAFLSCIQEDPRPRWSSKAFGTSPLAPFASSRLQRGSASGVWHALMPFIRPDCIHPKPCFAEHAKPQNASNAKLDSFFPLCVNVLLVLTFNYNKSERKAKKRASSPSFYDCQFWLILRLWRSAWTAGSKGFQLVLCAALLLETETAVRLKYKILWKCWFKRLVTTLSL